MSEFNRMTIVAAVEVISNFKSHSEMAVLEIQWGITERCDGSSKSARIASWSEIAINETQLVMTENGRVTLKRAFVETAINVPLRFQNIPVWKKLLAGLRFDGYEISNFETALGIDRVTLRRMFPGNIPGLDFRETECEVTELLEFCEFSVARGHLVLAQSAFQRGEWSSANGEFRKFYESYLNEIANGLGYQGEGNSKSRRDYLGGIQPQFLLTDYNEWDANNQKPQYVQGLMNRMHPHGGHPGLSEEEDATFRLQISLITARLFLRRYKHRIGA